MPGTAILQTFFDGLLVGAVYAAIGVTLTLVFGVMRIVTFYHGEFLMVALYLVYVSTTLLGIDSYVSIILVVPLMLLFTIIVYYVLIKPVLAANEHTQIVTTLAFGLVLPNLALVICCLLRQCHLDETALVGEVNSGWKIITAALTHERIALAGIAARARGFFDQLTTYIQTATRDGEPMARNPLVRDIIGSLSAQIEVARLLAVEVARLSKVDAVSVHQAAMLKVYASELMEALAETVLDLLGTGASLRPGPPSALIDGRFEYAVRDALLYTIGGGNNEIQRSLIASRGLNLPR
mgnify:CR=1 FL=1